MVGMGRSRALALTVTLSLTLGVLAIAAVADAPADALRSAVHATAGARTARVTFSQRVTMADRTSTTTASGALSGGDSDLVVSDERGEVRRVAVGTRVKERAVDAPDGQWRESTRSAPSQTTALGTLTLPDGISLGDATLYRTLTEAGTETVASRPARKIVGELDMAALAAAMRLGPADASRMSAWSGTLTIWVGSDGRVAKNSVRLVIPGTSGALTIEAEIELSDLDAPFTVTLP